MPIASVRVLAPLFNQYFKPTNGPHTEQARVGARTVFSRPQRLALLLAFAIIVIMRVPEAWVHGRFQAEEGTVFLAYAWHFPGAAALFRPFGGYLNLGANIPAELVAQLVRSRILPLERAPYFTMGVGLAFQLLPAVLILTGRAQWLESRIAVIAGLFSVATVPASEEVFYNTIHIQFHLALCVALILALDVPRSWAARIGYGAILFLAPLCGPSAIVVLPLFAVRALIDRDRGRLGQFAVIGAGAAVQLLFFYGGAQFRPALDLRTASAALFVRLILLPLAGMNMTNWAARGIAASPSMISAAAAGSVVIFGALVAIAARRRQPAVWLVLPALGIAAVSARFGIFSEIPRNMFDVTIGERYNFVPLALLSLSLVAMATQAQSKARPFWVLLVVLMLINGTLAYRKRAYEWRHGPDWTGQVRAWRSNHDYPMATWPHQWTVDLSDRTRACSPDARNPAALNDPTYCEGGWLAAFYWRK